MINSSDRSSRGFAAIAAFALIAAFAPASAALAADPAHIGCPSAELADAEKAAISRAAREGAPDTAVFRPLYRAVDRCGERLGWAGPARRDAVGYNISAIAIVEVRDRLAATSIDVADLERRVLAYQVLIRATTESFPEAALNAFLDRLDAPLRARIAAAGPGGIGDDIGSYTILRALMEAGRAGFAAH